MNTFQPSIYQVNIFEWVKCWAETSHSETKSLVIEAVAGSGKTTTALKLLQYLPENLDVLYLAFNKHIQLELEKKLQEMGLNTVSALTYHSLGFSMLRSGKRRIIVENDKIDKGLPNFLDKYTYRYLYPSIKRLVSLVKANMCDADNETLYELAVYHNIDLNGESSLVFDTVRDMLRYSENRMDVIDFDDMVYLPVKFNLSGHKYDVIIVDELQDTNKSQIELALMNIKEGGLIIGVGDRFQSIYGFRGADNNAIPNLIERLDAETLPLSISYRNPLSVVRLVNDTFPDITFEARDNAPLGVFETITETIFNDKVLPGNMVLCRVNAPLVMYCYSLIRKGIKATIRGRDIGKGLQSLIKKMKSVNLNDLIGKLADYYDLESEKLLRSNKTGQVIILQDKIETIYALSDGCTSIDDLNNRIDTVFSDEVEGVVFSSVHKAKGLEAQSVYILHHELMPHPLAHQSWEQQQEKNIKYVAYTRSLENLYIVEN